MKKIRILYLMGMLAILSTGCKKDYFLRDRFIGTWNIALYERELITQDGAEIVYSKQNAGSITFTNPFGTEKGKELSFQGSVETESGTQAIAGGGQIDDEASRWVIYYGKCNGNIGCDLHYTIKSHSPKKMEVFTISSAGTGKHYKLTMILRK